MNNKMFSKSFDSNITPNINCSSNNIVWFDGEVCINLYLTTM